MGVRCHHGRNERHSTPYESHRCDGRDPRPRQRTHTVPLGHDIWTAPEGRGKFTVVLGLDMGYGIERIEFNMQVSCGEAVLDLLPQQTAAWRSLRVKRRFASAIWRGLRLRLP